MELLDSAIEVTVTGFGTMANILSNRKVLQKVPGNTTAIEILKISLLDPERRAVIFSGEDSLRSDILIFLNGVRMKQEEYQNKLNNGDTLLIMRIDIVGG